MRFALNIGQTNAVKARPGLSGDTGGRLKLARVDKGSTSGIQAEYKRNMSGTRATLAVLTPQVPARMALKARSQHHGSPDRLSSIHRGMAFQT